MRFVTAFAVLLAFAAAMPLAAKENPSPAVNASSKDAFETVSAWVRTQMGDGGRYAHVTADERAKVNTRLDEMDRLFGDKADVSEMSATDKAAMFTKQEEVNAILAKHDNQRMICKYERPVGSHIPVQVCHTAAEIEESRRNSQQFMQQSIKSGRNSGH